MTYPSDHKKQREEMVKNQIQIRGISDQATIDAMLHLPRHFFVPEGLAEICYIDLPLAIGEGQTISQPYIVALMNELAEINSESIVLDVGTGSGYAAAVAAYTAKEVYTIERIPELFEKAKLVFDKLQIKNIHPRCGDGTFGIEEKGPYDAIIVAAASKTVPKALLKELKINGRLVIPIGDFTNQELIKIRRVSEEIYEKQDVIPVRFVPLIGDGI